MPKPVKSTSLKELGFTIKPDTGKDSKGNQFVYKVVGEVPVFHIKKTKKGRLVAVKDKTSTTESTIEGLFNFVEKDGDLIGQRATSQAQTAQAPPTPITSAA